MQFYEDMILGMTHESEETFTFTKENIIDFASDWDPMPYHIDEEAAKAMPLGKLFATSVHTIAVAVRLSHTLMENEVAAIAGLGWQDVKFFLPSCVGDTVRVRTEVIDKRESKSKPDRGIVTTLIQVVNQDEQVLTEFKILTLVLKRPA